MTDGSDEHQEATVDGQGSDPRPRRGFWFGLVVAIVKPFMLVFTKHEFTGRENMPRSGGVVFVTNHISHFDPLVLGFFIWECRRIPRLLGKVSVFKLPILGRIITSAGQIPVHRESAQAADAFRDAVAAVEKGECVGVYPEGTITRDPAMWPMTGKTGAARQAADQVAAAQDDQGPGRAAGRSERVPARADHQPAVARGNRRDHAGGRRDARRAARRDAAQGALRSAQGPQVHRR